MSVHWYGSSNIINGIFYNLKRLVLFISANRFFALNYIADIFIHYLPTKMTCYTVFNIRKQTKNYIIITVNCFLCKFFCRLLPVSE